MASYLRDIKTVKPVNLNTPTLKGQGVENNPGMSNEQARSLQVTGFTRIHSIAEAFEGDTVKDGPKTARPAVNGWKNANLPLTSKTG